jgi:hypothetical protein
MAPVASSHYTPPAAPANPVIKPGGLPKQEGGIPVIAPATLVGEPYQPILNLAADASALYLELADHSIVRSPLDHSPASVIAPKRDNLAARRFVLAGDAVVVSDRSTDRGPAAAIYSVPKTGGKAASVAPAETVMELASDGKTAYLLLAKSLAKLDGGAVTSLATWDAATSARMVVDDTWIYLGVSGQPSTLYRLAKTGGAVEQVAKLPDYTELVGLDANRVWLRSKDALLALAKTGLH